MAFWLPCGSGNFFHISADGLLLERLGRGDLVGEFPIPAREWWSSEGGCEPTPSGSVIRRALWAASCCGWTGTASLESTRGDDVPEMLELRLAGADGEAFELKLDADGWHIWRSAGEADLRGRLAELLGEPEVVDPAAASRRSPSARPQEGGESEDVWVELDDRGYLPFFQLNMLFGGLFNQAFIPAVFFESGNGAWKELSHLDLNALIDKLLVRGLPADASDKAVQKATFQRFLDVTFEESLAPVKWRLERTRRALLESMLASVVHRRRNLKQLRERLPEEESFDGANEPQLRGYVMLVGGKLPVLQNVQGHVRATIEARLSSHSDLKERGRAWAAMLDAIAGNLAGLETAIHQAWMERTLYEQEQARAEQEALAEMQRSQVGGDGGGSRVEGLFAVLAFIPTIAAFFAAGGGGGGNHGPTLQSILIGCAFTALILLGVLGHVLWRRWRNGKPRLFYELNLRLDAHVDATKAGQLLDVSDPQRSWGNRWLRRRPRQRDGEEAGVALLDLCRGSLRVERISDDDALFKLHIDGAVAVPGDWRPWRSNSVPVFVICELLHHRPSTLGEYIYRELRLICPAGRVIDATVLDAMVLAVAKQLIDPFVSGESLVKRIEEEEESSTTIFRARMLSPSN